MIKEFKDCPSLAINSFKPEQNRNREVSMRKLAALALILLLAVPSSYASTTNISVGMGHKAIRGAIDLVTGIVEVPMQTYKGYKKGFKFIKFTAGSKVIGTILGLFRGFGHAGGRIGSGALGLYGFWAANPPDNQGIGVPFDAEYAWQMGEQYDMFKPSLKEGAKPIGRKFIHGVADGLLGIAEVPGQIKVGVSEHRPLIGVGKGFWFWFSRMEYGFGNIWMSLVPNHPDNPGYPFNGKWPWSALLGQTTATA